MMVCVSNDFRLNTDQCAIGNNDAGATLFQYHFASVALGQRRQVHKFPC